MVNIAGDIIRPLLCCVLLLVCTPRPSCSTARCGNLNGKEDVISMAYNKQCLLVTKTTRSWENSKEYCDNLGLNMVENIDGGKQDKIESTLHNFTSEESWIGLRRIDGENSYKWASGTDFDQNWIPYVSPEGRPNQPIPTGMCVATAGASTDRTGGGWRTRPCSYTLLTICETDISDIPEVTSKTEISSTGTTVTSVSSTTFTTLTTTTTTKEKTSVSTVITTTKALTSVTAASSKITSTSLTSFSKPSRTSFSIYTAVTDINEVDSSSSKPDDGADPDNQDGVSTLPFVILGVVLAAVIFALVGFTVFCCRYRRKKTGQTISDPRLNSYDYIAVNATGHSDRNTTSSQSNSLYATPSCASTKMGYDHIMLKGRGSRSETSSKQTYDIANVRQGEQPQPTFDATYDRAIFGQLDTVMDSDVYDRANVTLIRSEVDEKKLLTTYDHVFIQ